MYLLGHGVLLGPVRPCGLHQGRRERRFGGGQPRGGLGPRQQERAAAIRRLGGRPLVVGGV